MKEHRAQEKGLVSVVMATYNMAPHIRTAVQSVLDQTYDRVEVLIVDDGSTDNTPEVVEKMRADRRVQVHRQANQGQAAAKNKGIELAHGEFVAFLDADDEWMPRKLELQLPLFERSSSVGVVYSAFECMNVDGKTFSRPRTVMHRGEVSGRLLIENFVCFPSAVVRRECIDRVGAFVERYVMGIDYDLWLRISAMYEFDFVREATVRYRVWSGQMSRNHRKRFEAGIEIMRDFLAAHPKSVEPRLVGEAWAHTYMERGNAILWAEGDRRAAVADYIRSLSFRPLYWPAWRSLLRALVTVKAPKHREDESSHHVS
jgi:glycosyltransferase involved in cell wall biosynthesis